MPSAFWTHAMHLWQSVFSDISLAVASCKARALSGIFILGCKARALVCIFIPRQPSDARLASAVRTATGHPAILPELFCILGAAGGGGGFAYPPRRRRRGARLPDGPERRAPHCARGLASGERVGCAPSRAPSKATIVVKDISQCSASGGPLRALGS